MALCVNQVYTSAACNRIPEIVDWNNEGLICYGACNAVIVYNTNITGKDPLTVLSHHLSRINSVKWIRKNNSPCSELVSCSADKTAAIWSLEDKKWKVTSSLTGHIGGVTSVFSIYKEDSSLVVYTASVDSTVKIWERRNGNTEFKQTINLNGGLCLTLYAHLLPIVKKPVLLCALDDFKIHVFSGDEYHRVHTLVGHEDWVRGLDIMNVDESSILVASASQDTYIRLWRIQQHVEQESVGFKVEEKLFDAHNITWSVKLDAVLSGHEGWVYGVQWHPPDGSQDSNKPIYRLLSSSLDKTLIIWEPEGTKSSGEGAWSEHVRVGEVGGNGLGFYGSRFGPNGTSFLSHGYNGSFHIWSLNETSSQWEPQVVCGGHYSAVEDARWEPNQGLYLMTVSTDQTTRVHAPWKTDNGNEWHEIARPQVHGYDMASLALVSPRVFASAAEEKVIRIFEAPNNFVTNFKNIVGQELGGGQGDRGPQGASVPSLGLSNKAVFSEEDKADREEENDGYFVPVNLTEPPTEETLMQNTLWPEIHKAYGHGYEVFALDASDDLLASACRATGTEHAAIILWDTSTWKQVQKITSHNLTITQLSFSPDGQFLLSVSRDRRWFLSGRRQGTNRFSIVASTDKKNGVHARIIWCCSWFNDSQVFATGSRDGKICVWTKTSIQSETSLGEYGLHLPPLELSNTSVTALSFAPKLMDDSKLIAMGFESGTIRLYAINTEWNLLKELNAGAAHHLTVRRLSFKPLCKSDKSMILASCGSDHLVRIHEITVA